MSNSATSCGIKSLQMKEYVVSYDFGAYLCLLGRPYWGLDVVILFDVRMRANDETISPPCEC